MVPYWRRDNKACFPVYLSQSLSRAHLALDPLEKEGKS